MMCNKKVYVFVNLFVIIIKLHSEVIVDEYIHGSNRTTTVTMDAPNSTSTDNLPMSKASHIGDDDIGVVDEVAAAGYMDHSMIIPPIYILNLDRSRDRWIKSQQSMKKAGLHVNRLPAVGKYIFTIQYSILLIHNI